MLKFQAAVWNASECTSIAPLRVHMEEAIGSLRRRVRCHPRGHPTVAPAQTGCVAYVHPSAAANGLGGCFGEFRLMQSSSEQYRLQRRIT
ncbi:hypothetical protein M513_08653 [Trichuris suis]|uniref:Uncharacterized protein n=1 Tax=Trichuris suis TaxID=68888 RepID=A0A085LZN0_9BILA|nr:hypothetical protein M513_08653 [Trichuris suis]